MLRLMFTLLSTIVCVFVIVVCWRALAMPEIANKQDFAMAMGFAVAGIIGNIVNWFVIL